MSRAFTKEDDAGEDLPERPIPEGPNYVTPRGLAMLKEEGEKRVAERAKLKSAGLDTLAADRDLRYLEARIAGAIVVPPGSGEEIRFGAAVELESEDGERHAYRIVGDDEARTGDGLLSWSSPLALAILGAKAGDTVSLDTTTPPTRFVVRSVSYPPAA